MLGHVLQQLGNIFAESLQLATTVRAGFLLRQDLARLARQMRGQRPPRRSTFHFRKVRGNYGRLRISDAFRSRLFQFIEPQL